MRSREFMTRMTCRGIPRLKLVCVSFPSVYAAERESHIAIIFNNTFSVYLNVLGSLVREMFIGKKNIFNFLIKKSV